jgi:phage gp45-like
MITKDKYLKALEIVEEYHNQLKREIINHKPKLNDIGLKRGDYIVYIGGSESKYLTKNKQYRLTCEPYRDRICIINDNGNRMNCNQSFFNAI